MSFFSIIIPVYNASNTLGETLDSVHKQTFTDFEVILVDDGSTDDSARIAADATADWENVRMLAQANHGLGHARNTAAKVATGEWLAFLDADDSWSPDRLHELAAAINREPDIELIYHPVFEKYANGSMRKRRFVPVSGLEDFISLGNPFVPSALAIKKDIFFNAGGFIEDRNQVEDLLLWFRLLNANINICALLKPKTVYRMGYGVTANIDEHLQKVFRAVDEAEVEGLISSDQATVFKERKYYEAARQLHKTKKFANAMEFYKLSKAESLKVNLLKILNQLHFPI